MVHFGMHHTKYAANDNQFKHYNNKSFLESNSGFLFKIKTYSFHLYGGRKWVQVDAKCLQP